MKPGEGHLIHWPKRHRREAIGITIGCCMVAISLGLGAEWFHPKISALVESNFVGAAIGSAMGALGGAYGAHLIAMRTSAVSEATAQIRASNSAIALAIGIHTEAMRAITQFVKPAQNEITAIRAKQLADQQALPVASQPASGEVLRLRFVGSSLGRFPLPIDLLQDVVHSRLSLRTFRTLQLAGQISSVHHSLNRCLEERARLVDDLRELPPMLKVARILGGVQPDTGKPDDSYPRNLQSLTHFVEALALFSLVVKFDVMRHKSTVMRELNREYEGIDIPEAHTVRSVSPSEEAGPVIDDLLKRESFKWIFDAFGGEMDYRTVNWRRTSEWVDQEG
jgi:hypothetical protein